MTINAEIIADSLSPTQVRITTMRLRYPRIIHSEFMTHRQFSRNASSSRAVPARWMINEVMLDPAMPSRFGAARSGMQDAGELPPHGVERMKMLWLRARDKAVETAEIMLGDPGIAPHKQVVNRLIEPFSHITVLVTSTNWANFFALRDHPDADPTIAELAAAMKVKFDENEPRHLGYADAHLPFIQEKDYEAGKEYLGGITRYTYAGFEKRAQAMRCWTLDAYLMELSVARCARVSYSNHDGTEPNPAADRRLFSKLMESTPLHASPAEHQAVPDKLVFDGAHNKWCWVKPEMHGNFFGWRQFRKSFENEAVKDWHEMDFERKAKTE